MTELCVPQQQGFALLFRTIYTPLFSSGDSILPSSPSIMTEELNSDVTPFDTVGAFPSVFPKSSWAHSVPSNGTSNMCGQFGACTFSSKVSDNMGQLPHIHAEFLHINQDWLLQPQVPRAITPSSQQWFVMCRPAEKFQKLTEVTLGVGAIAIIQWVASTSDSGEPILTCPLLVVLGMLIGTLQMGGFAGYELDDLGLSYQTPVQPLGKTWSSQKL